VPRRNTAVLAILLQGSHHARNLELGGSVLDQSAVDDAVQSEDWVRAEALITDEIVRRHAASGQPEQVRRRLAAFQTAGLDEIVLSGARDGTQLSEIMNTISE
jgi:5,10-methylenetetrahydromethanopterin reductase